MPTDPAINEIIEIKKMSTFPHLSIFSAIFSTLLERLFNQKSLILLLRPGACAIWVEGDIGVSPYQGNKYQ